MKTLKFIPFLVVFSIFTSCSDTNVLFGEVDESVDAAPISGQFTKRVLIEDYTGAWCGNCARVAYAIDLVFAQPNNRAVAVAIHNGGNDPSNISNYDPFNFAEIGPLKNLVSPDSDLQLPQSRLNRTINWTYPERTHLNQVKNLSSTNCGLGLSMNSSVSGGNINLGVDVKFAQNYSNLKLVVYLLESHLIFYQENYTPNYGGLNPIPNFEHNHVLRKSLTNILGDAFTESTTFGKTISRNFTIPVPANILNNANIDFVAFVVDSNNNVINVRASKVNETQSLEENL